MLLIIALLILTVLVPALHWSSVEKDIQDILDKESLEVPRT